MSAILAPVVIGAATGLGTGALSAVVTPWAAWGVEKRRARDGERRRLVAEWRAGIQQFASTHGAGVSSTSDLADLMASSWYNTFRDSVRDELCERWERPSDGSTVMVISTGQRRHELVDELLAELSRLERDEWGLV